MPRNHSRIEEASQGILPEWSKVSPRRLAHMHRVASLMLEWATTLELRKRERRRWYAAGLLHDALKGERAKPMRSLVPPAMADLPVPVLHGPAAAARLMADGVEDHGFLNAVAFHTLGHPAFDQIGLALYAADFLEPGRTFRPKWRGRLMARMPFELKPVVSEIVGGRIEYLVGKGRSIRPETFGLWNALNGGDAWAPVSAEF